MIGLMEMRLVMAGEVIFVLFTNCISVSQFRLFTGHNAPSVEVEQDIHVSHKVVLQMLAFILH